MLQSGLAALADVTGRWPRPCGINGGVTLATPDGGWAFAADAGRLDGAARCPAAAERPGGRGAGRAAARGGVGADQPGAGGGPRRLKVHDVGGLLALAPIVQKVPGIPGGPILQLAARTIGGAGGMLGRLFGRG